MAFYSMPSRRRSTSRSFVPTDSRTIRVSTSGRQLLLFAEEADDVINTPAESVDTMINTFTSGHLKWLWDDIFWDEAWLAASRTLQWCSLQSIIDEVREDACRTTGRRMIR